MKRKKEDKIMLSIGYLGVLLMTGWAIHSQNTLGTAMAIKSSHEVYYDGGIILSFILIVIGLIIMAHYYRGQNAREL